MTNESRTQPSVARHDMDAAGEWKWELGEKRTNDLAEHFAEHRKAALSDPTGEEIEAVAKAICENGVSRPWDDLLPVNAHDFDHSDMMTYARAAATALIEMRRG